MASKLETAARKRSSRSATNYFEVCRADGIERQARPRLTAIALHFEPTETTMRLGRL
jgi:hypothetical protein